MKTHPIPQAKTPRYCILSRKPRLFLYPIDTGPETSLLLFLTQVTTTPEKRSTPSNTTMVTHLWDLTGHESRVWCAAGRRPHLPPKISDCPWKLWDWLAVSRYKMTTSPKLRQQIYLFLWRPETMNIFLRTWSAWETIISRHAHPAYILKRTIWALSPRCKQPSIELDYTLFYGLALFQDSMRSRRP